MQLVQSLSDRGVCVSVLALKLQIVVVQTQDLYYLDSHLSEFASSATVALHPGAVVVVVVAVVVVLIVSVAHFAVAVAVAVAAVVAVAVGWRRLQISIYTNSQSNAPGGNMWNHSAGLHGLTRVNYLMFARRNNDE